MYSLRRTLAVRFSLTMFVALVLIALWAYLGAHSPAGTDVAADRTALFFVMGTVVLGTVATAIGAGWLAASAVRPVEEITAQADGITPHDLEHRITVHADVVEYQGLIRVLNDMLARLDHAFTAQRRIIADVGHDLRTPLTAMRGEIELALRHERSPEQYRTILASVLEETERLSSMSDALITLARADAGQLAPCLADVDLTDVAAAALARIEPRRDGRTFALCTAKGDDTRVLVDATLLGVALDQLLDNAVRHTRPRTRVDLTVEAAANEVAFLVSDSGPGLPADALLHLFERFYRGDASRSRAAGAGLGLSVAAAILAAHGGTIRAAASPTGGLEVRCAFPRQPTGL